MKLNNIYIIKFKLNNKNKYVIWYTDINENDKIFNYKYKIKTFSSLITIKQFIKKYSNDSIEVIEYDLDLIIFELKNNKFN